MIAAEIYYTILFLQLLLILLQHYLLKNHTNTNRLLSSHQFNIRRVYWDGH